MSGNVVPKPKNSGRIWIRLGIVFVLLILIVAPTILGVVKFRQRRFREILERQAAAAEDSGDAKEALRLTLLLLEARPGNFDAMARYGRILSRQAVSPEDRRRAKAVLRQVCGIVPSRRVERRMIADIEIKDGEFTDAAQDLTYLVDEAKGAELAEIEEQIAECLASSQKPEEAVSHYQKAIQLTPDRIVAYTKLAKLLREVKKDSKGADELMDRMVRSNPRVTKALLERATYRNRYGLTGSREDILEARNVSKDDPETLVAASEVIDSTWSKAEIAEFKADIANVFRTHVDNASLAVSLARLQLQDGQTTDGLATLNAAHQKSPDNVNLRWMLADVLLDLGRIEEAKPQIEEMKKAKVQPALIGFLEARVLISESKWAEAARVFEEVRPSLVNVPGLKYQVFRLDRYATVCYERLDDIVQKENMLRRGLQVEPNSVPEREELARIMAMTGRFTEAIDVYRDLLGRNELTKSPRYHLDIAKVLLLQTLKQPIADRKWVKVESALNDARKAMPENLNVNLFEASLRAAQGKPDDARSILLKARDTFGDRQETWLALSEFLISQGEFNEAIKTLDEARRRIGDRSEFRFAKMQCAARMSRADALKILRELEKETEGLTGKEQRVLLDMLASTYEKLGEEADSDRVKASLFARFPNELSTHLLGIEQAFHKKSIADTTRELEAIRMIEGPGGPWGDLHEIRILLLKSELGDPDASDQARALAAKLAPKRPTWRPMALLQAEIEDKRGSRKVALEGYLKAISRGETNPVVVKRAAELLFSNGNYDEASSLIRPLRDEFATNGELRRLNEQLLLKTVGPNAAIASARKAVDAGSKDYNDYIWLGKLIWTSGKKEDVEPLLRRAISLSKAESEPWMLLLEYLSATNQKEKAEAALKEADQAIVKKNRFLDFATMNERLGHSKEADDLYQRAIESSPDDPSTLRAFATRQMRIGQIKKAEPFLRTIAASKRAGVGLVRWARINLAILLSESRENAKIDEALALLESLDKESSEATPEELRELHRAQGIVLARQPGRPRRADAIRLLEEVVHDPISPPADRLILVALYEEEQKRDLARKTLEELLPILGQNAEFLALYSRTLLRDGDPKGVRPILDQLKKVDKDSYRSTEIEARVLNVEGKPEQAEEVILNFVKGKDPRTLILAAALLEEMKREKASESLIRTALSQSDSMPIRLNLATFLTRTNRAEEALALCEKEDRGKNAEQTASVLMYILSKADLTDSQRDRIGKWLEEALARNPKSPELLLRYATLRDLQGKYQDAESLYRRVIESNPGSPIPLNNLAWILAFQERRTAEALALINQAIAMAGPLPDLLDTRAIVYLSLKGSDSNAKAVQDIEKAVAGYSTPTRLFHKSQVYQANNELRLALEAFDSAKAAGLSPKMLHALERPAFEKLSLELTRK